MLYEAEFLGENEFFQKVSDKTHSNLWNADFSRVRGFCSYFP